ncbi:hypothetical protein BH23CHL7_BH23CHL7_01950 [soil metagenome]
MAVIPDLVSELNVIALTGMIVLVLVGGIVSGATAMGGAQFIAAGLAFIVDPRSAVILLAVLNLPMAALQVVHQRRRASELGALRWLFIPAVIGVPCGLLALSVVSARGISIVLGLLMLAFVAVQLTRFRPAIPARHQGWLSPVVGGLAGVATGMVGVAGPVLATYLIMLRLPPVTFASTISRVYLALSVVRFAGLVVLNELTASALVLAGALLVPAFVGQRIGFALQGRASPRAFQLAVLALLAAAGVSLLAFRG